MEFVKSTSFKYENDVKLLFQGKIEGTDIIKPALDILKENRKKVSKNTKTVMASYVSKDFPATFESKGIIFETERGPDLIFALDNILLNNMPTTDEGVEQNAILTLKHKLTFDTLDGFLDEFNNIGEVKIMYNHILVSYGLKKADPLYEKHNEVIFIGDLTVKPKAFFGISERRKNKIIKAVGDDFKYDPKLLKRYPRAVDYFIKKKKED